MSSSLINYISNFTAKDKNMHISFLRISRKFFEIYQGKSVHFQEYILFWVVLKIFTFVIKEQIERSERIKDGRKQ